MAFQFAIRKLKRVLDKERTLAAIGADRFAPGRVKELSEAIEILSRAKDGKKNRKRIKLSVNQIPLFK